MSLLQEMAAPRRPGEPVADYRARLVALVDIATDLVAEHVPDDSVESASV